MSAGHDPMIMQARARFSAHVHDLQDRIVAALATIDPTLEVRQDLWTRVDFAGESGGGGRTRVLTGEVFESGGVNVSEVFGAVAPTFMHGPDGNTVTSMWAAGISLIIHPRNPRVPTVHANFRMIDMDGRTWFGGGADLTPYYPHTADFTAFHRVWADATRPLGTHQEWKDWCDRYFTNHHRAGEMRGIGGVFFDHWRRGPLDDDAGVVIALSEHFLPSYLPIVRARMGEAFTEADDLFMQYRHGRYVEFNLLHDRGTKFGLESGGRTESILVSLPTRCRFGYSYQPPAGSPHAEMMQYYRPRNWLDDTGASQDQA